MLPLNKQWESTRSGMMQLNSTFCAQKQALPSWMDRGGRKDSDVRGNVFEACWDKDGSKKAGWICPQPWTTLNSWRTGSRNKVAQGMQPIWYFFNAWWAFYGPTHAWAARLKQKPFESYGYFMHRWLKADSHDWALTGPSLCADLWSLPHKPTFQSTSINQLHCAIPNQWHYGTWIGHPWCVHTNSRQNYP